MSAMGAFFLSHPWVASLLVRPLVLVKAGRVVGNTRELGFGVFSYGDGYKVFCSALLRFDFPQLSFFLEKEKGLRIRFLN